MYFIGLDVHKKTISFCVKDAVGRVLEEVNESRSGSNRPGLCAWPRFCLPDARRHQLGKVADLMESLLVVGWSVRCTPCS
jgi:hypothetical protein